MMEPTDLADRRARASTRRRSSRRPTARRRVRAAGRVTFDGRPAQRLVIDHAVSPVSDPDVAVRSSRTIALFDAKTLHPLEFVDESVIEAGGRRGRVVLHTRYATFETLPRTPENRAQLRMPRTR